MTTYYSLVLGILCVWRITFLFNAEDGPGDVLVAFRRVLGAGFWGKLLDCFYCLSLWVALPFGLLLADTWPHRIMLWLALSAGASLLERMTQVVPAMRAATYTEDPKEDHALLRKSTDPVQGAPTNSSSH